MDRGKLRIALYSLKELEEPLGVLRQTKKRRLSSTFCVHGVNSSGSFGELQRLRALKGDRLLVSKKKKMDSEDDMDFEGEDEEMLDMEKETLEKLRAKEYTVVNPDGTLRCPLSPSRKKQQYAFKDLLQHATAVASGKRGPEAAGKHSALKKYLEVDLSSMSTPPVERFLKVEKTLPRRRQAEDMLVCPWSVVIYNIDNRRRDLNKPEIRVGLGKTELRLYFEEFNPVQLEVCWGPQGHLGMCVLHFGRDLAGLRDAQALDYSFLKKDHGLRDYERKSASGNLGEEFYGWLAREDDFRGRRCGRQGEDIGRHLRKVGNLKDIEMFGDETRRMHDQQVQQLAATVSKKSKESQDLKTEMESIRITAEHERGRLEEAHKLELEAVRMKARISEEEYNQATVETNRALEKREAELRQLDKELREKESKINSAAEKNELHTKLMENEQLREMLANQHGVLQQKQMDKLKLLQKHEEENRRLIEQAQEKALKLAIRQKTEMEREQLRTVIETEKLFDKLAIKQDSGHESKKVEELEQKLADLESNAEYQEETINTLALKERKSNDELVYAKKMAVEVLLNIQKSKKLIEAALKKKYELDRKHQPQARVEVHMAGSIDEAPWPRAFEERYKNDPEWGMKMKIELSTWDDLIRDPEFQPFKTVQIGSSDKWEKRIDHQNKKLVSLKKNLGENVYNSIATALMELEEYNGSGRYPIAVPWIFEEKRPATLAECIAYEGDIIQALMAPNAPRKKPRN